MFFLAWALYSFLKQHSNMSIFRGSNELFLKELHTKTAVAFPIPQLQNTNQISQ